MYIYIYVKQYNIFLPCMVVGFNVAIAHVFKTVVNSINIGLNSMTNYLVFILHTFPMPC